MIALKAPAKINWFLRVMGKRPDGYHEIASLFQTIALYDTLIIEPARDITVLTDAPVPMVGNLVYKAAMLLRERTGVRMGACIRLDKRIPIAAGLGGGSSDAASALLGLNELWGLGMGEGELRELGLGIGSDVPFFLGPGVSLVTGRGEVLYPAGHGYEYVLALVNPGIAVSAGWAYSNLKSYSGAVDDPIGLALAIGRGEIGRLEGAGGNSLEDPVIGAHPTIGRLKEALIAEGALYSAMSGSGSSVFGVFEDESRAGLALEGIEAPHKFVVRTLKA